jgi:hypothetical protein
MVKIICKRFPILIAIQPITPVLEIIYDSMFHRMNRSNLINIIYQQLWRWHFLPSTERQSHLPQGKKDFADVSLTQNIA